MQLLRGVKHYVLSAAFKGLLAFFVAMACPAAIACTIAFSAAKTGDTTYNLQGAELASCDPSFDLFYGDSNASTNPASYPAGGASFITIDDTTGFNPGNPSASVFTITYHGDGTGAGLTRTITTYTYDVNYSTPLQANTIQVTVIAPPVANAVNATVAHGSSSNGITLNISGGAATSVAVDTQAAHGTATASGTSIAYTPSASYSGSDSFTYTATNASGTSSPATVSVTVSDATLTYAPPSPVAGVVGVAYSQSLASASGGTAPYSYALASGVLPAGVVLASNGMLSGTPTAVGSFNFTVTATDSSTGTGPFTATSGSLALNTAAPTISVNPASLTAATVGNAYSQTVTASGGTSGYTYAVTAGALPSGLTLSSSGVVSGTPTAGGSFNFTVTVADSSTGAGAPYTGSRAYTLTANAPTITITPTSLSAVAAGAAVSGTITANGGVSGYSYAVTAGSLPPGTSLSSAGVLSGAATSTGTYNFTVTATDSSTGTGPYTGSRAYSWTVNSPVLTISPVSGSSLSGSALSVFNQAFTPAGGSAPYVYGIVVNSGSMPSGLSFSTATGVLSGTPTAGGTVNFTVSATDSTTGAGAPFSVSGTYSLTVGAPTIIVAPAGSVPNPAISVIYSQTVSASGGSAPYTFVISAGALPAGLTLSSAGVLSGTPTAAGTFNFTVQVTDANNFSGTRAYSVTVAAPTLSLAPASLANGNLGSPYSQTITAGAGTAPYSYAVSSGALPSGLSLSSSTGVIQGTPDTINSYNFTITATDSTTGTGAPFTSSKAYTVAIGMTKPIAGPTSVNTLFNTAVLIDLAPVITGGSPASVSIASLPAHGTASVAGLKVNYTPVLDYVGSDSFTYTATNPGGSSVAATVTITVTPLRSVSGPSSGAPGAGMVLGIANSSATCTLTAWHFNDQAAPPAPLPVGYGFPYALVDFTAKQCDVNSALTVTLTFPNPVPNNAVLMKYDAAATPVWRAFPPTSISGNQVTYVISDGGTLDADRAANGEFVDPVILALAPTSGIPTLDRAGLVLLGLTLLVLGAISRHGARARAFRRRV